MQIVVDNIKCGGCANTVKKGLLEFACVQDVAVDVEQGLVDITLKHSAETLSEEDEIAIKKALQQMGYPESGSLGGLKSAGAKAKSFVSCAIGKMSKE